MKNIYLMILLAVFALACTEDGSKPEKQANETATTTKALENGSAEASGSSGNSQIAKEEKSVPTTLDNPNLRSAKTTLEPDVIAKFLPKNIQKSERSAVTLYKSDDGYSSASVVYKFNANMGVDLRIMDNGPTAPIFDERFFRELPYEKGLKSRRLQSGNSTGYIMETDDKSLSTMSILYNNRINIFIKTTGTQQIGMLPEDVAKYIKINEILDLLK